MNSHGRKATDVFVGSVLMANGAAAEGTLHTLPVSIGVATCAGKSDSSKGQSLVQRSLKGMPITSG